MKDKKEIELMEFFNMITKEGLTPNQFFVLYHIRNSMSPPLVNLSQELRGIDEQWLVIRDRKGRLQPKAISLIQKVEGMFVVKIKKTNMQIMGDDHSKHIETYLDHFPRIKLPSGKPARTNKKMVEPCFRWFFENFDYTWEEVLKATEIYVDDYKSKKYMYMQTSQYFVRKQNIDKTWRSELADWCEMVRNGDEIEEDYFKENVV